ncbi:UNVERIFIED_CONTAM: Zinc finger BED domain-containing protein RICESLEEPER 1 [Sesamum calycinum]|uniref:Zinc finger BED domain-containing protein RICESLEEPER 1 n=1 Tax=Sesamum calycinum TaxID=2727403 RepID=A0AAW2KTW3_9LAMI
MLFGVAWRIWGIESKIHTISVDNASANDSAIENLKIYVRNKRRLLCEGRLFHVSEAVNLPEKKLVDDCRTRWNSTYEMLAAAIKFKDVFPRFADRSYIMILVQVQKIGQKRKKYARVKVLLDKKALENDIFIRDMVAKMKSKFDKYWGDSNLLMSIAAVLDPRCKLRALEFCFPRLYSSENVERQIAVVRKTLYELYLKYLRSVESIQPQKSELDLYLEENCYIFEKDKKDGKDFDVLEWWRVHALKHGSSVDVWRRLVAKTLWSKEAFE